MTYTETRENLFEVDTKYYLVHCISSDAKMGAGIALEFRKRFGLLITSSRSDWPIGTAIMEDKVFSLVTKSKYYNKPTYATLMASILYLKILCENNNVKHLAMPKIGCGLDRLSWEKVRTIIQDTFKDTDIEILVCSLQN